MSSKFMQWWDSNTPQFRGTENEKFLMNFARRAFNGGKRAAKIALANGPATKNRYSRGVHPSHPVCKWFHEQQPNANKSKPLEAFGFDGRGLAFAWDAAVEMAKPRGTL